MKANIDRRRAPAGRAQPGRVRPSAGRARTGRAGAPATATARPATPTPGAAVRAMTAGEGTEHTNTYGGSTAHAYGGGTEHTNTYGGSTYGAYGSGAYHTYPSGATAYHPPGYPAYPTYPVYHPPVAVPYYSTGCYGCAAAAGAVVGMAAGAAVASANTAAATSNAYSAGVAAGSATTAAATTVGVQRGRGHRRRDGRRPGVGDLRDGHELRRDAGRARCRSTRTARRTTSAATPGSSRRMARTASTTSWCRRRDRPSAHGPRGHERQRHGDPGGIPRVTVPDGASRSGACARRGGRDRQRRLSRARNGKLPFFQEHPVRAEAGMELRIGRAAHPAAGAADGTAWCRAAARDRCRGRGAGRRARSGRGSASAYSPWPRIRAPKRGSLSRPPRMSPHEAHHVRGAQRVVRVEPVAEQRRHLARQPQHRSSPRGVAPAAAAASRMRLEVAVVELRNHRRDDDADRHAGRRQRARRVSSRRCGAGARGSSVRASSRSSVRSRRRRGPGCVAAIGASRSRSRSTSAPLVAIVSGCSHSAQHLEDLRA